MKLDQIKSALSQHLAADDKLKAIGVFKKVPSTSWLLLTRGFAWLVTQDFHVGVTDQHLVILPVLKRCGFKRPYDDVIIANFNEVHLHEGPLKNTMLDIQKTYKGEPLNLRYKNECVPEGMDLYDFITAVKQK